MLRELPCMQMFHVFEPATSCDLPPTIDSFHEPASNRRFLGQISLRLASPVHDFSSNVALVGCMVSSCWIILFVWVLELPCPYMPRNRTAAGTRLLTGELLAVWFPPFNFEYRPTRQADRGKGPRQAFQAQRMGRQGFEVSHQGLMRPTVVSSEDVSLKCLILFSDSNKHPSDPSSQYLRLTVMISQI